MAKEYYLDGEVVTISEEYEEEFLRDYGDHAEEKKDDSRDYTLNGEDVSVPINSVEEFESKYPEAKLLAGKSKGSATSATAGQSTKARNRYDSSEFASEDILSEYQLNKSTQQFQKKYEDMPEITSELVQKPEELALQDLQDKWMEYGFTFSQKTVGLDRVEVEALNGEKEVFNLGFSSSVIGREEEAKRMDKWMRERAEHQGDKLQALLAHVSVNSNDRTNILKDSNTAKDQLAAIRNAWGMGGASDHQVLQAFKAWSEKHEIMKAQTTQNVVGDWTDDYHAKRDQLEDAGLVQSRTWIKGKKDPRSKPDQFTNILGQPMTNKGNIEKMEKLYDPSTYGFNNSIEGSSVGNSSENLQLMAGFSEDYIKDEALREWSKQTKSPIKYNTIGELYDEEGKLTEKGAKILNSKEYKDILNTIEVDDKKRQDYIDKQFSNFKEEEILKKKLSDKIKDFSGNVFVKSDTQKELVKLAIEKDKQLNKDYTNKVNKFNVVYGDLENIYKESNNTADWLNSIGDGTDKLEEIKSKYDLTTEKGVKAAQAEYDLFLNEYKDKRDRYDFLQTKKNQYETFANKISDELDKTPVGDNDLKTIIKSLSRNYQTGTVFAGMLANSGVDLAQGIMNSGDWFLSLPRQIKKELSQMDEGVAAYSMAVDGVNPNLSNNDKKERWWDEANDWLDNWQQTRITDRIAEPISFDEIEDLGSFGEWTAQTIASQIPILATMWATGGASLYVMGASSTGSKWRELQDAKAEYDRTGGLYGTDHSWGSMFVNAGFTGAAEALSEKVTLAQVNKLKGLVTKSKAARLGYEKTLRRNIFTFNNVKAGVIDRFEEGFSESLAQLSSNWLDVQSGVEGVGVYDGIPESFVSGVIISQGMAMPSLYKALSAPFRSADTNQRVGEMAEKIEELTKQATALDIDSKERNDIENEIIGLVDASNSLIEQDTKRVNLYTDGEKKALINIEKQNYQARKKAEDIILDGKLSDKEKIQQLADLNAKVGMRNKTKNDILLKYDTNVTDSNYEREMDLMKRQAKMAEDMGGVKIDMEEMSRDEFTDVNIRDEVGRSKEQIDNMAMEREAEVNALQEILKDKDASKSEKDDARRLIKESKSGLSVVNSLLAQGNDYGVMIPVFNKKTGNLERMRVIVNKDTALTDGQLNTGAHEFLHAAFRATLKGDTRMRNVLGAQMQSLLDSEKMEFTRPEWEREYKKRIAAYAKDKRGEEMFTILSEMYRDGKVKINESLANKVKDYFRRWSRNYTSRDIAFNETQDVLNFIKDFDYNLRNNIVSPALARMMAKGANGKIFEEAKESKKQEKMNSFDQAVDLNRRSNPDLKREFDQFVLNSDGTPKYQDHEQFKNSPDYTGALLMLLEGRAHDGLIMQGATDDGVQPTAMREFIQNVKQELARRFQGGLNKKSSDKIEEIEDQIKKKKISIKEGIKQIESIKNDKKNYLAEFNYDIVKDDKVSLFGWLTGTYRAIHWAKEDVKKAWVESRPGFGGPSLDKPIATKEGTSTLKDVLPGEGDSAYDRIDEMDLSFGRKQAAKEVVNEVIVSDALDFSPDVMSSISSTIRNAKINLEGLTYKGVKRLLDDVTKFTKIDKKTGKPQVYKTGKRKGEVKLFAPTSEKKTEPIGPLFEVLNAVATEFGVDPLRILSTQDLDGTQRQAAQSYILDKSTNEDGSFNSILYDLLPEGEDRSGWATGVANTSLGEFYIKGDRVKMSEGAVKEGGQKAAQTKRKNVSRDEFLNMFGIEPNGRLKPGTEADGAIREMVRQVAQISASQVLRLDALTNGTSTEAIAAKLADGKSERMFSRKVEPDNLEIYQARWDDGIGGIGEVNMDDKKAIVNHLTSVYGDALSKKEIRGIANDWYTWKKEWEELPSTDSVSPIVDKYDVQSFIIDKTNEALLDSGLMATFKDKLVTSISSVTDLFNDIERVRKRRGDVVSLGNEMIASGKTKQQVLRAMFMLKGMFSSAAKAGDGRFISDGKGSILFDPKWEDSKPNAFDGNKWKRNKDGSLKLTKKGNPIPKANRGQVFINQQDFINTLSKIEGFEDIKGKSWKQIGNDLGVDTGVLFADKSKEALKDKDYEGRLKQSKEMREASEMITQFYVNGIYDGSMQYEDLLMLGKMFGSNMQSPMKKAANLRYIAKGVENTPVDKRGSDLEYEHMKPTNKKIMELFTEMLNNPGGVRKGFWDDYTVAIIPKAMDIALISSGLRDFMQLGYRAGMAVWKRYYNSQTFGKEGLAPIKDISTGEVIGEEFVRASNKFVDKKKQSIIQETKSQQMKSKKVPEPNGMSAFDFDETIIIGGDNFVIATNPENGQTERISSEDWPIRGAELTEQGWSFNFDDFINVRGGVEGPLFQKLKNRIKKFGPGNNFILTARPQESAVAIHGWLQSKGIDIPLQNITGLGDSSGDSKALWILDKFSEGYNDIYFVDDALPNVQAVKHVMDQLDIKGSSVQALAKTEGKTLLAEEIADKFNDQMKKWREGPGRKMHDEMQKITTVSSSEFKRIGGFKVNIRTEEGRKIVEQLNNIKTTRSSESDRMKSKFVKTDNAINEEFNDMLERQSGIDAGRIITAAEAKKAKATENIFQRFFVPPSAEDFKGLLYKFLGKGKRGDKDFKFFKENLLDPFAEAIRDYNAYRQNMSNDYAQLQKDMPGVVKGFNNEIEDTGFTNEDAIRVYLWNKAGFEVPGFSPENVQWLVEHVEADPDLVGFAEGLSRITKRQEGYVEPDENWAVTSIAADLNNVTKGTGRKEFLSKWINNKNVIFSKNNLNKIEAIYGKPTREALENILYRMENGTNRTVGQDATVNRFLNWINGSVGAVMFFNTRSALLQTISTVNFINWEDNNIFKAAAAFANQKQFWSDFAMIFNSDMLKQRRGGLQMDVNFNELADAFQKGRSKPEAVIRYLLEKGFLPTKLADSFAIAMGGSTFYRNRVNSYIKDGNTIEFAEQRAWKDFQEIAEETQQSSRPDLISEQQAGVLGRLILAWQNTPMQMTRLTKKALSDLVNGRGDPKSHISRIMYYGLIQNIIFGTLQTGLAFLMFGGSEEEEEKKKKTQRVLNGALDTLLRGTGVWGAAVSTVKNTVLKFYEQRKKGWTGDQTYTIIEAINLSPPIGSKIRKIYNAIQTDKFNKGVGEKLKYRIENPTLSIVGNLVEAATNFPMARLINKVNNVEEAITGNHEMWQRIAMLGGWNRWSVGAEDEELEEAKQEVKDEKAEQRRKEKEEKKVEDKKKKEEDKKKEEQEKKDKGIKTVRCSGTNSSGKRCGMTTETNAKSWKCIHHMEFKDGDDRDGDGLKEYQCTATTSSGRRCRNKTENTNKKCYAHQ